MIRYYKLFDLLERRGLKRMDMVTCAGLGRPTMTRINKGQGVSTDSIDRLCAWLGVQPGDIMEYLPDQPIDKPP